jgi:glycosyltransferase involved in cell wall biosynthesis
VSRKLLFVVNVDWFFFSHRLPIAKEAIRHGYQVHVATVITDHLDDFRENNLIVHPITLERNSAKLNSLISTSIQLWRIFNSINPDLVHLVTIKPVLLGGIIARLTKVPAVVVAISGLGFVFVKKGLIASVRRLIVCILYRIALGHPNLKVVFQNFDDQATLRKFVNLLDNQIVTIRGSGVDLTEYYSSSMPTGTPVVILASRMLVEKGIYDFISAIRLLRKRGFSINCARFALVGDPDPMNPGSLSENELNEWVKEGVVEWWGYREDMPQIISAANLVVLPSYYGEGLPKVLIEAAASCRPVITTDHPGCRDAIEPNITGILVPPRNELALADAIQELINDPNRSSVMGKAGRKLAENEFDVRKVATKHMLIYQELME